MSTLSNSHITFLEGGRRGEPTFPALCRAKHTCVSVQCRSRPDFVPMCMSVCIHVYVYVYPCVSMCVHVHGFLCVSMHRSYQDTRPLRHQDSVQSSHRQCPYHQTCSRTSSQFTEHNLTTQTHWIFSRIWDCILFAKYL